MANDMATGLILRGGKLECTTLKRGRDRHTVVDAATARVDENSGTATFPPGVDSDEAALANAIRSTRGKRDSAMSIGLSPQHVFMRVVELPTVEAEELDGMIQLQVDKFSPFATDAVVVSHEVLSQTDSSSSVLIVVSEEKTIASIGDILKAAGAFAQRIDVETLSWLRLIRDDGKLAERGTELLLLRDLSSSQLIVLDNAVPIAFTSLGATGDMSDEDLCSEIGYSLTSLELERGIGEPDRLTLWHRGAQPRELSQVIEDQLSLEVHCEPFESLPSLSEGLARRLLDHQTPGVNLCLPEWREAASGARARRHLVAAAAAAVGLWLLGVLALAGALQYGKHRFSKLEDIEKGIQGPAQRARDVRTMLQMLQVAEDRTGRPASALACLNKVAEVVPHAPSGRMQGIDEIRLFHYDVPRRNRVEIRGEASDPNYVYDFEKALNNSGMFADVELKGPRQIRTGKHSFTILMGLPTEDEE